MSLEATRLKSSRPQSSRFEVPDRFNLDQPVAKQDLTSPNAALRLARCRLVSGLIC
jgi:hypothetical protein